MSKNNCSPTILPTPLDNIHATMYALDRVRKERCNDTEIKVKYPGIQWETMDNNRMYPCPTNITNCEHGKCRIVTESQCNAESQVPFDINGNPLKPVNCNKDSDCNDLGYDAICNNKSCQPKNVYLEWNTDINKCVFGNFALRKWCEYPKQRRTTPAKGVTDVPAFNYIPEQSKCQITKDYCDWMKVSYKIDDKGTPTCYETAGQSVAEFLLGKTIFRDLFEGFQHIGPNIMKLADRKYSQKHKILQRNFGGSGIHLYDIKWKNGYDGPNIGFFSDEIKMVFPEIVVSKNNLEYLHINLEDTKKNPKLKRIYLTSGSTKWITESIFKGLQKQ